MRSGEIEGEVAGRKRKWTLTNAFLEEAERVTKIKLGLLPEHAAAGDFSAEQIKSIITAAAPYCDVPITGYEMFERASWVQAKALAISLVLTGFHTAPLEPEEKKEEAAEATP